MDIRLSGIIAAVCAVFAFQASAQVNPAPQDPPAQQGATQSAPPTDLEPAVDTSAPPARSSSSEDGASGNTPAAPPSDSRAPARGARGTRGVQDRIELDTTQITGNRELPKVMYIVPWKRSDLGDLVGKPVNSLLDEVLSPVDRDVFRRENRYYQALQPGENAPPAGKAGARDAQPGNSAAGGSAARDEK